MLPALAYGMLKQKLRPTLHLTSKSTSTWIFTDIQISTVYWPTAWMVHQGLYQTQARHCESSQMHALKAKPQRGDTLRSSPGVQPILPMRTLTKTSWNIIAMHDEQKNLHQIALGPKHVKSETKEKACSLRLPARSMPAKHSRNLAAKLQHGTNRLWWIFQAFVYHIMSALHSI